MPRHPGRPVALVAGAASGTGLATARAFAQAGASIVLIDRKAGQPEMATWSLTLIGSRAIAADFTQQ